MPRTVTRRDGTTRTITSVSIERRNASRMEQVIRVEKSNNGDYYTNGKIINAALSMWLKWWFEEKFLEPYPTSNTWRYPPPTPPVAPRDEDLEEVMEKFEPNRYIRDFRIREFKSRPRRPKA